MKNQNQVRKKGSGRAVFPQAKSRPESVGKSTAGGITFVCQDQDGREWARVHFEPSLASRLEAASLRHGVSLAEILRLAISEKIAAEGRAA
jgi:hypothetical protein